MADTSSFDPLGALVGAGLGYATTAGNGLNQQQIGQAGQGSLGVLQQFQAGTPSPQINQNILSSYNNPYLDASIQANQWGTLSNFQNNILPSINDTFSNAGSFGSGRQAALTGEATRNLTQQLADIDAKQRSSAYNAAYNAAISAGENQYANQYNAANKIYGTAATNAGQAPWINALAGAGLGASGGLGGANSVLGASGSTFGNAISKLGGSVTGGLANLLGLNGGKAVPGTYPLQNGGTITVGQDGIKTINDGAGNISYYNPDGSNASLEQANVIPAGDSSFFGSGSTGDTSAIDNFDYGSLTGGAAPVNVADNSSSLVDSAPDFDFSSFFG